MTLKEKTTSATFIIAQSEITVAVFPTECVVHTNQQTSM